MDTSNPSCTKRVHCVRWVALSGGLGQIWGNQSTSIHKEFLKKSHPFNKEGPSVHGATRCRSDLMRFWNGFDR